MSESDAARPFLSTPEWAAIRTRIVGDGRPPLGRPESLLDLARLFRWSADGAFSEGLPTPEAAAAYLHAATELEAYDRDEARRAAPTSPAPRGGPAFVPALGGARVPVPAASPRTVSFAEALSAVQAGAHIARDAWPDGTYVAAQAGYPQGIGVNANTAAATWLPEGAVVAFGPYLIRCEVVGETLEFGPWTPGQGDLFAADWRVILRPDGLG